MQRANHNSYFSRRQALGLFATTVGALLLAACGGAATPDTATATPAASAASSAAPSVTARAASSSTRPGATPGTAASATGVASPAASTAASPTVQPSTPRAATPRSGASPVASGSGQFLSGGTDLGRMLATVPVALSEGIPPFPGDIGFANIRQQLSNYGYAGTTSIASLKGDQLERFLLITYSLSTPPQATMIPSTRWDETDWRATVGYDFWQVDRALECGRGWVRLEGRFDQALIAQALIASGRTPSQYREGTIHSYGPDNADYDSNDVVIQKLGQIGTFGRVTLEQAALSCFTMTRHAETAIDVRAGRVPSLLTVPDYDALAFALDPVVSVQIAPLGERYVERGNGGTPVPSANPAAGAERLPPYTLMAMGLQDDGTTHTMLIALVYERAEDARIAAPLLRRRLENYESVVNRGQKLRDFAIPGEPQLVTAGARTVVVQPLALKNEQALQRWVIMFMGRDTGFLREY